MLTENGNITRPDGSVIKIGECWTNISELEKYWDDDGWYRIEYIDTDFCGSFDVLIQDLKIVAYDREDEKDFTLWRGTGHFKTKEEVERFLKIQSFA